MGVEKSTAAVTPGIKTTPLPEEDDLEIKPVYAKKFKRIIARANLLAQDRLDI